MKSSIGSYVSLFLLDFAQTEIACLNSISYLNRLEQFLVNFTGKNMCILCLLHTVS